jgi:hypothetical protein
VHCRQGIGRSGIIVGGVLIAAGKGDGQMNPRPPIGQSDSGREKPTRADSWYATFSLLDIGGATGSSTLRSLFGMTMKLWRLTIGRLTDRNLPRAVV